MTPAKQGSLDLYQFEDHLNQKREKVDEYFDEIIAPLTENNLFEKGVILENTQTKYFCAVG